MSRCKNPRRGYQYVEMHQPHLFILGTLYAAPRLSSAVIGMAEHGDEAKMRRSYRGCASYRFVIVLVSARAFVLRYFPQVFKFVTIYRIYLVVYFVLRKSSHNSSAEKGG